MRYGRSSQAPCAWAAVADHAWTIGNSATTSAATMVACTVTSLWIAPNPRSLKWKQMVYALGTEIEKTASEQESQTNKILSLIG